MDRVTDVKTSELDELKRQEMLLRHQNSNIDMVLNTFMEHQTKKMGKFKCKCKFCEKMPYPLLISIQDPTPSMIKDHEQYYYFYQGERQKILGFTNLANNLLSEQEQDQVLQYQKIQRQFHEAEHTFNIKRAQYQREAELLQISQMRLLEKIQKLNEQKVDQITSQISEEQQATHETMEQEIKDEQEQIKAKETQLLVAYNNLKVVECQMKAVVNQFNI